MEDTTIHEPGSLLSLLALFVQPEYDPVAEVIARRYADLAEAIVSAAPNEDETRTALRRLHDSRTAALLAVRSAGSRR